MAKQKKQPVVSVKFRSPSFRYKGKKYISKDVYKAAESGDEDAIAIMAQLAKIKSGVLEITEEVEDEEEVKAPDLEEEEEEEEEETPPPAPEKPKATKAPKKAKAKKEGGSSE